MAQQTKKSKAITYAQAIGQIQPGKIAPVYLIYGEEKFLHDEIIDKIIDISLDSSTKDFNFDLFYGSETPVDKIVNVVRSFPMMAERRVVIVKNIQQLKATDLKHLADYVSQPSKTTCLILSLPERKKSGKWLGVIFNNAISINCRNLYDNEVPGWVASYLKTKKLEMENQAVQLLQAQVGNSLLSLVNELEKIQINIHPRTKMTQEDVQSVTSISRKFNVFELCNAVGEKKFPRAIAILSRLLEQGEAPTGMIIQLMRHFMNLIKINENIRKGKRSVNELMKATGLNYYFVNNMMIQAKNYSTEQYRDFFSYLAEADLHLKTSYQTPGLVLELLLYRLIKS